MQVLITLYIQRIESIQNEFEADMKIQTTESMEKLTQLQSSIEATKKQ